MHDVLRKIKSEKSLSSFYYDDEDQYSVGYVHAFNDEYVIIRSVSAYGEITGYEIQSISSICRIEVSGKYEKSLLKMIDGEFKFNNEFVIQQDDDFSITDLLSKCANDNCLVSVWHSSDNKLTGTISSFDAENLTIDLVDEFGCRDSQASVRLDDIIGIDINTKSEQKLDFLHRHSEGHQ